MSAGRSMRQAGSIELAHSSTSTSRELAVIAGPLAQPRTMNRPGLALQDHAIDRAELAQRRQLDVTDLGALQLQGTGDVLERGRDLGLGRHVDFVEVADEAHA